jgi:hypothetical protein
MRAKKIDANQTQIVNNLRQIGVSVFITSMLGKGFPDLVLGYRGKNYLIELKDGNKVKSQKKLTDHEQRFFDSWQGQVAKCESIEEIIKVIFNQ